MDALISQVKHEANSADEAGRQKILDGLRDLAMAIETPADSMQRIMFLHLQIAVVRVGVDIKLFNLLYESDDPLSLDQLTKITGADPTLLARLLRFLGSFGIIKEMGKNSFAATNVTQALAKAGYQAGIRHYFDTVGPQYQKLPEFLAATKYQNPTNNTNTVFQQAWNTDVPAFIWLQQHPEKFDYFNQFMAIRRHGMPIWLSVYPIDKETKGWNPENPVFVDVGGGIGHQCLALRNKYPQLPGRVILQDLPRATEKALPMQNVEVLGHDFFQPQPIKDSKFYYLRNVLHDYPDDKCRAILKNLVDAMGKDSSILIDEMVLPDSNVPWHATQLDLTMMAGLASVERTKEQWYHLLDSAGLKIVKIYTYTISLQESIIVVVPK
ncbi:hypothetical protein MMC22_001070 [Lobaria immixta]|nr:hypothetical protein [Lobaria immixta]